MQYVYLLWDHGEYGPEHLVATLDKRKLPELAKDLNEQDWFERTGKPNLVNNLAALLELDNRPGIYPLMDGWGGLHLQIVELS